MEHCLSLRCWGRRVSLRESQCITVLLFCQEKSVIMKLTFFCFVFLCQDKKMKNCLKPKRKKEQIRIYLHIFAAQKNIHLKTNIQ